MADSTEVVLARIEVKLDTVIRTGADHEVRLRVLESRPISLTSKALWSAITSGVAAIAAIATTFAIVMNR